MIVQQRLGVCVAILAFAAAAPAVAEGATLTNAGGTLTFLGNGNTVNQISFDQAAAPDTTVSVTRAAGGGGDNDPITASGCTQDNPAGTSFTCPNVTALVVDTAGLDDSVGAFSFRGPITLSGGTGDDDLFISGATSGASTLNGGAGNDSLSGGPAKDTLNGGDGDDSLFIDISNDDAGGADVLSGGNGIDFGGVFVSLTTTGPPPASAAPDVSVSLDGVANDGATGEGANLGTDIEDVQGSSVLLNPMTSARTFGHVTITGNASINSISGSDGNDTLDGLAGNDSVFALGGDDTVNARDGYADRIDCGPGTDTANVDTLDQVSGTCENVLTGDVGNANEDKPPTIAWAAPAANAKLAANTPTTLQVNAADDKGVSQVQFLDDDRVVCTDTVAPYTCAYQARGDDVGRNTLVAIASDALGQTASSVRTVTVDRFTVTTVSLTLKPTKDKSAPWKFTASGKLTLPATVGTAACADGVVAVIAKAGSRTISTRTDDLSKTCAYSVTVTFTNKKRFPSNGKLKFQASFRGNIALQAKRSSTKTVSTK
jgi:hypothetical protein